MKNFSEIPWDKLDDYQIVVDRDNLGLTLRILTGSEIIRCKFPDALSIILIKLLEIERETTYKRVINAIQDVRSKELL